MPKNNKKYDYDQDEVNKHILKAITDISNALEQMQKLMLNIVGLVYVELYQSLVSPRNAANEEE